MVILLAFGAYLGTTYFGHLIVPNSDFPSFSAVGREVMTLQKPHNFKRVPVWGIMHVSLGYLVGGNHPELSAALILNAVLLACTGILLYLIGRETIGAGAPWFALICLLCPIVLRMLVDPILETCLLFFTVLTFYFLFRRSRWVYLFACITTMVRYEGAGLIVAAFVVDMFTAENNRRRVRALIYVALASLPLGLWLLATKLSWHTTAGRSHYLRSFGGKRFFLSENLECAWRVSIKPLLLLLTEKAPGAARVPSPLLLLASQIVTAVCCLISPIYAVIKRNWHILALFIYMFLYTLVHIMRSVPRDRYYSPVAFVVLLLVWFGLQACWKLVNRLFPVPKAFVSIGQTVIIAVALIWLAALLPFREKLAAFSRHSQSIPAVASLAVILLLIGRLVVDRLFSPARLAFTSQLRRSLPYIALSTVVCLMAVSNQYTLARMMGNGDQDIEFKRLADWYCDNADPSEKLVTTLPGIVSIYAPQHREQFRHTQWTTGNDFTSFIQNCYKSNITYVAWDSRLGFTPKNSYYKKWGLASIAPLIQPKNRGPLQFIRTIPSNNKYRFINLFRLRPQPQTRHVPAPSSTNR